MRVFSLAVFVFLHLCGLCTAQALINIQDIERQVKVAAGGTSMTDELSEEPKGAHVSNNTVSYVGNITEIANGTMEFGKVVHQSADAIGQSTLDSFTVFGWKMGDDLLLSASSTIPSGERENQHSDNAYATGQIWNTCYVRVIGEEGKHYRHRARMTVNLQTPSVGPDDHFEYECYRGVGSSYVWVWWNGVHWRALGTRYGSNGSSIPIDLTVPKQPGEFLNRTWATYQWTSGEDQGFPVETEGLSSWGWVFEGVEVRTVSPGGPYEQSQGGQKLEGGIEYQGWIETPTNPWSP